MTGSPNITNPSADPIVGVVRDMLDRYDRLDELQHRKCSSAHTGDVHLDEEIGHLYDMVFTAKDNLANFRAQSAEGAMLQLLAAIDIIGCLMDSEYDERATNRARKRFMRLVYSAVPMLCDHLKLDPNSLGIEHFMSAYLDPWVHSDEKKGTGEDAPQVAN